MSKSATFSKDSLKRAAIYCRVSTEDQDCQRQENDLRAFAERAGFEVVAVYKEKASGAKNDRAERAKILKLAQAREIDAVLVTELSRWGRSTADLLSSVQIMASRHVSLLTVSGMEFDLSTPQGKLFLTMLAGISEFERDLIAERTRSGLETAKARGTKLGRPQGNKTDEKHRQAVLTLRQQGFGYRDIADKLKIGKDTVGRICKHVNR